MSAGISRRAFLKGAVIGAGALAGLNAGAGNNFLVRAADKVKRGGIWRLAQAHTPPTLDAQRISMYWASIGAMYDCLLSLKTNPQTYAQELVPGLATEWQVEKAGRRIVFNLRKGVRFHDGSRFDASIAKWNLDRVRTHPKSYLKADLGEIESVEVLNEYSIALNLKYPSGSLLYNLSDGGLWSGMVSKAFQEKHGDDELARKGCGTGPFRCKEWIVDQKIALEKFPEYWRTGADGKPLPYLDGFEEHYRPKIDQAVLDLRAGSLDTVIDPASRDVPSIKKESSLEYIELPPFEWHAIGLGFNSRKGPFTSHALRKAACCAIDRERIVKILGFGVARVHQYPWITKGQPGWAPEAWPDYSFNAAKAAELVKADYPRGVTVDLLSIAREPDSTYAELLKAMWDKVGIKTELKSMERLGWIEAMRKDNFHAGFWNAAPYMGAFIRPKLMTGAPGNWSNFRNPQVDKMLEEHLQTLEGTKQHELMRDILKIVYETAELTSAFAVTQAVGTHKKVKGIRTYWRHIAAGEVWMDS